MSIADIETYLNWIVIGVVVLIAMGAAGFMVWCIDQFEESMNIEDEKPGPIFDTTGLNVGDKFIRLNNGSKYEPFKGVIKAIHEDRISIIGSGYLGGCHYGCLWGDLTSTEYLTVINDETVNQNE